MPRYTPDDAPLSFLDSHLHLFVIEKNTPSPPIIALLSPRLLGHAAQVWGAASSLPKWGCTASHPASCFAHLLKCFCHFRAASSPQRQVLLAAAVQPPCSYLESKNDTGHVVDSPQQHMVATYHGPGTARQH